MGLRDRQAAIWKVRNQIWHSHIRDMGCITTAASNGSVNSMHDSYTPFGGLVPMLMQLMRYSAVRAAFTVYAGVCHPYSVYSGLMVGLPSSTCAKDRTFEMKMAVLVCLATPVAILVGSGIATLLPSTHDSLNNPGAHGLSEVLYAYSSAGNNGSAFAGFNANTPFLNVSIGLIMLFVGSFPCSPPLAIAGSLAAKKKVAVSPTLPPIMPCLSSFDFPWYCW